MSSLEVMVGMGDGMRRINGWDVGSEWPESYGNMKLASPLGFLFIVC